MEITLERLPFFLKRPEHFPLYLVTGNEIVLVQEALSHIQGVLKSQGFLERELHIIEEEFDWPRLLQASFQRSLLTPSSLKIIECRLQAGHFNSKAEQTIERYCEKPSKICVWLLSCPQIPKAEYTKPWLSSVREKGVMIPIWKLNPAGHRQYIHRKLREAGLSIKPEALQILAHYTEGNLLAAQQTLEHFRFMALATPITEEIVRSALSNVSTPEGFDLIEYWLKDDMKALFSSLAQLKMRDKAAPLKLVGAFVYEVRQLTQMAEEMEKGTPLPQVLQIFKVWPRRRLWVTQKLQKTPLHAWYALWKALKEIEYTSKGVQTGDVWQMLTALWMSTSQAQSPTFASS